MLLEFAAPLSIVSVNFFFLLRWRSKQCVHYFSFLFVFSFSLLLFLNIWTISFIIHLKFLWSPLPKPHLKLYKNKKGKSVRFWKMKEFPTQPWITEEKYKDYHFSHIIMIIGLRLWCLLAIYENVQLNHDYLTYWRI